MSQVADKTQKSISSVQFSTWLGRLSFYVFISYLLFGHNKPFSEPIADVSDIATENILNQIVFLLLLTISTFSLKDKISEFFSLLKKEKWLSLFLLWAFVTLLWSDYPMVSFKRIIQVCIVLIVCLGCLLNTKSLKKVFTGFKYILYVYILACFLSVLFVPGAVDSIQDTWRGLANDKNQLGQESLVCIFFSFFSFRENSSRWRFVDLFMLIVSLTLLAGSKSMTPTLTLLACILIGGLWAVNDSFAKRLGTGTWFFGIISLSVVAFAGVVLLWAPYLVGDTLDLLGKDRTFTGRTELWLDIFNEAHKHFLVGAGFEGFWVVDNPTVLAIYRDYPWLPRQAHMGYLDILNETGVIGLALLVIMIGMFFYHACKMPNAKLWVFLFLMVVIINFQETTFFKTKKLVTLTFVFSYLAVYVQVLRQRLCFNSSSTST